MTIFPIILQTNKTKAFMQMPDKKIMIPNDVKFS